MSCDGTCDVCTGGKTLSGRPCICGGEGTCQAERVGLRKKVLGQIMTPRQQEISAQLMKIYAECHVDCEASREEAAEKEWRLHPARCAVCDLISAYHKAQDPAGGPDEKKGDA